MTTITFSNEAPGLRIFLKQISVLTLANLKSRYRKTLAGFLWVILNPILIYGVQSQVFSKILKVHPANYYLFLLSGLLPWLFISKTLEMCTPLFENFSPLIKAFQTNPLVYLIAQVIDNLINFLAAFFIILVPVTLLESKQLPGIFLIPIPVFFMAVAVGGLVWLFATVQVFYTDTKYLIHFILSIAFFLTPIFYPIEYVPESFRWLVKINPFYILIAPFRACVYDYDLHSFFIAIFPSAIISLIFPAFAFWFWRKKKSEFYFNV